MKEYLFTILSGVTIIVVLLKYNSTPTKADIQSAMEAAYFKGQSDAINQNIHITMDSAGNWQWASSPWDSAWQPIFDPSTINNK